jgi:hypothetical protein
LFVILSMRLRPHPESKPPSYHGSRESRRYRQRQKLLGQALSEVSPAHARGYETNECGGRALVAREAKP